MRRLLRLLCIFGWGCGARNSLPDSLIGNASGENAGGDWGNSKPPRQEGGASGAGGNPDSVTPAVPVVRFPWNGYSTGTPWASDQALSRWPRRPTFIWEPVPDVAHYELEIDDSCSVFGFEACPMSSPEARVIVEGPRVTLSQELPISEVPPVGRRYFWRVRACTSSACSGWSSTRYLNVGRLDSDLNGDGYGDIVFASTSTLPYVVLGSPNASGEVSKTREPSTVLDYSTLRTAASVGDVNGDGFAEALFGECDPPGHVAVGTLLWGQTTDMLLSSPMSLVGGWPYGALVSAAGDLDGDGLRDVVVGDYVMFAAEDGGFPRHVSLAEGEIFKGWRAASAGDVNGDGYPDLLVGRVSGGSPQELAVVGLYWGGVAGRLDAGLFQAEIDSNLNYVAVSGGEFDADGFADIAWGFPADQSSGAVITHRGGREATVLDSTIPGSEATSRFGFRVAMNGDGDGDGLSDLLVQTPAVPGEISVYVRRSNSWLLSSALVTAPFVASFGDLQWLDFNGDGYDDVVVLSLGLLDYAAQIFFGSRDGVHVTPDVSILE